MSATTAVAPIAHTQLLRIEQVAELLSVGERTVWRWASAGRIPAPLKLSNKVVRWRQADIDEYLARLGR